MKTFLLIIACLSTYLLNSQQLSVDAASNEALRIEGNSPLIISFSEGGSERGYFGSFSGNNLDVDFGTMNNSLGKLHLSPNGIPRLTIDVNGYVGIGTDQPTEKLTINNGDICLESSDKGIILNASNNPLITRGWDPFTSGSYSGIGRWGLFLHSNRLTFGIPNMTNKGFEFARYDLDSTRDTLLNISHVGQVSRPPQGDVDLLPIVMGVVDASDGSILGGTGNFSVQKIATGIFHITITNELYNKNKHIVSVMSKHIYNSPTTYVSTSQAPDFDLVVNIFSSNGGYFDQGFQFIVYRPF